MTYDSKFQLDREINIKNLTKNHSLKKERDSFFKT
jgi:hypothetical protein